MHRKLRWTAPYDVSTHSALNGPRDYSMMPPLLNLIDTFGTNVQVGPKRTVHQFLYVESVVKAHVQSATTLLDDGRNEYL